MNKLSLFVAVLTVAVAATVAMAGNLTISTNTVWSGTVTVDGTVTVNSNANLTIQPGTIVNFVGAGTMSFNGAGTLSALGTPSSPIQFNGSQCGTLTGNLKGIALSNCVVSGMGSVAAKTLWMNLNPLSAGVSMSNCTVSNSGPMQTNGVGAASVTNCDLRDMATIYIMTSSSGSVTCSNNKIQGGQLRAHSASSTEVGNNVIINGTIWCDGAAPVNNVLVHDNYIHDTSATAQYGLQSVVGQIYNNVIRGGTWTTGFCGGHMYNNVIESLTKAEGVTRGDSTHEQVNDCADGIVVERNIILNPSMGAFMTASTYLAKNAVIRNNTFDMRGVVGTNSSGVMYFNHLAPTGPAANINVRNNLFLRTGRIGAETDITNTLAYSDYNCWAGRNTDQYATGTSARFVSISMTGKAEGDDGFGMHDVTLPTLAAGFNPASLVANADFVDPYADADMLAGTHTTAQLLALYQQAFTPVAGSALINAGSPADASDPAVAYGQVDIGAIEVALLPGDANMDRKVTFADYVILERNFGATNATWAMGDFNGDGKVTFADYIMLETSFGKSVPEPMTLSLLAVGGLAMLKRRS